ncbi:DUF998 domain-containing protein [Gordonia sp. SID5947]|uniref:DUF998 domain-containing protein n=1 Tax=Gordonia sp. SID5947 TaxID=2690315 RepID=UPI00136DE859|nr:DUF998 domain-containing protein [Gordonia sp. SID5947]MYR07928.1 DUF998 domain-containing protein [Gordonia sp. SID5947]
MSSRVRAGLLIVGAITYSSWVVDIWLRSGVDPFHGYVSELGASDRPDGTLYRTADLFTALLVGAAGVMGLASSTGPRTRLGWGGLIGFAIATAFDSRVPMTCAPSIRTDCATAVSRDPLAEALHGVFSAAATATALLSSLAFLSTARSVAQTAWMRVLLVGAVSVLGVATLWTLLAVAVEHHEWLYLGLAQRAQLLGISVWLVIVGVGPAARGPLGRTHRTQS